MLSNKDKKVAIIIAAGSGMGADAAKNLFKKKFKISILSSTSKGKQLAENLGGMGVIGSNQSIKEWQSLIDLTFKINSAGHGPRGPILELTDNDWHEGMETYFLNVVRATRLVTPIMQNQKSGVIINISTFATFEPDPIFPTSGVFRAGLSSFTKLFADKYAKDNIRMNNILPGFINSLPEKEEFKNRIPLNRYGTVQEI